MNGLNYVLLSKRWCVGLPHLESISQLFCWCPGGVRGPSIAYVWKSEVCLNALHSPYLVHTRDLFQGPNIFLPSPILISFPELKTHFLPWSYTLSSRTKGLPSPWHKLPTCCISGPNPLAPCGNYYEVDKAWNWIASLELVTFANLNWQIIAWRFS